MKTSSIFRGFITSRFEKNIQHKTDANAGVIQDFVNMLHNTVITNGNYLSIYECVNYYSTICKGSIVLPGRLCSYDEWKLIKC